MPSNNDVQLLKLKRMLADAIEYLGAPPPPIHDTTVDALFDILFQCGGRLYVNSALDKQNMWSFCIANKRGVPIYFDEKVI